MHNKILNITNGDYFNAHFMSRSGGTAIPFCEVMMDGKAVTNIYSQQFVALRAEALNISENEYRVKMYVYDTLKNNDYQKICLWFGKDTFCQVNLLTLLAYLEQIEYQGELKLNYIDDETSEVLDTDIDIKLGIYSKIYEDVLISKIVTNDVGVLCARAIDLFFDYHSDNGELAKLVRANAHKEKTQLISLLLGKSKDYGLSDLQAERLINSILPEGMSL
ncbi:MAG: hypothetical protein IKV88_08115 [Clostridia bacterium]|nr:hypothetical protein [Clostridia bacterium]